jgi:hypothetical protein
MGLCHRSPATKTGVGYHRNCDGVIYAISRGKYVYLLCGSCKMPVVSADVMDKPQGFVKQQRSGRRKRIKKYDISSWRDVK